MDNSPDNQPNEIHVNTFRQLLADGNSILNAIREIRGRYGLDLVEAKNVMLKATIGVDIHTHQEHLAKTLSHFIENDDDE